MPFNKEFIKQKKKVLGEVKVGVETATFRQTNQVWSHLLVRHRSLPNLYPWHNQIKKRPLLSSKINILQYDQTTPVTLNNMLIEFQSTKPINVLVHLPEVPLEICANPLVTVRIYFFWISWMSHEVWYKIT